MSLSAGSRTRSSRMSARLPDLPDPIKMPASPLAPGQVEVKLGARRYVLNVPEAPAGRTLAAAIEAGDAELTRAGRWAIERAKLSPGTGLDPDLSLTPEEYAFELCWARPTIWRKHTPTPTEDGSKPLGRIKRPPHTPAHECRGSTDAGSSTRRILHSGCKGPRC